MENLKIIQKKEKYFFESLRVYFDSIGLIYWPFQCHYYQSFKRVPGFPGMLLKGFLLGSSVVRLQKPIKLVCSKTYCWYNKSSTPNQINPPKKSICLVVVFLAVIFIVVVFVMVIFAVFNLDVVIVVVMTIRQKKVSPNIYNPGDGKKFKEDFF